MLKFATIFELRYFDFLVFNGYCMRIEKDARRLVLKIQAVGSCFHYCVLVVLTSKPESVEVNGRIALTSTPAAQCEQSELSDHLSCSSIATPPVPKEPKPL